MIPRGIREVFRGKGKKAFMVSKKSAELDLGIRAYNDMLYLCEKFAPLDRLEKYDAEKDISVTGAYVPFLMKQLE